MKYSILLMLLLVISCKKAEEPRPVTIKIEDSVVPIVEPITEKIEEERIWVANEFKLPIGNVVDMDCSNAKNPKKRNIKNNYVTIKRLDNTLTFVKDIDEDLYLNLRIGDKIR